MMSDDGFKPEETSTGGEKLSASDFWDLVAQGKSETVDHTVVGSADSQPTTDGSLEDRLLAAQSQGLAANLRRQLAFVGAGESFFELQALGVRRYPNDSFDRSRAAHARGPEEAVRLCTEAETFIAHGIYLLPARLRPGVESRHASPGRWFDVAKGGGTTDSDVEARLILAVDFDVKRPSGISATEEEVQRSVRVATNAWSYLAHHLGENSLAYLHSGNGRQIHVALDAVAVTEQSKSAIAGLLTGLAHLFNTPEVTVDEKLFDAKRILPACGTMKKKGATGVTDRPHRRTAIVTPAAPTRVALDAILALARHIWESAGQDGRLAMEKSFGVKPQTTQSVTPIRANPGSPFDVANAVDPQAVADWLGLYNARGEVVCPGCGETSGVAVLNRGLHCHHNRCKESGVRGFRSNVDLVAEVHRVTAKDAVLELSERFGLGIQLRNDPSPPSAGAPPSLPSSLPTPEEQRQADVDEWLPPLGDRLKRSVARAVRRAAGIERPVPLPWKELEEHFGGGLWPGLHVLCSGTGAGKTAAVLQISKHAAEQGVPVAYVGLEMDDLQFDLRVVGEEAKLRWSDLYTGRAGKEALVHAATTALEIVEKELPFHPINRNPMSWPASKMIALAAALRQKYPEPPISEDQTEGGPGSRPILIVLDYLQIVGPEEGEDGKYKTLDLRERIGRAAYALREVATNHNISILVVASVARDKYGLWPMVQNAELQWEFDKDRVVNRRIAIPDVLVGLGKESGEIEYGADSVSVLSRVPDTYVDGQGESVVFATAKGRATGARWTPMHFTGFRYESARDGGDAVVAALGKGDRAKEQKKAQKEEERKQVEAAVVQKKEAALSARDRQLMADREACVRVVRASPGIGVRDILSRMKNELNGCGRERADAAIAYCESSGHIVVVRTNPRDVKHYTSDQYAKNDVCVGGSKKSPHTPLVGAPHAPHVGVVSDNDSATPATPATHGKNKVEGVALAPATPATRRKTEPVGVPSPPNSQYDSEEDANAMLEAGTEPVDWHELATGRGWGHAREARARDVARRRAERARADWQSMHQVALRGQEPRSWATELGWDDERIRVAEKYGPPAGSTQNRTGLAGGDSRETDADALSCMTLSAREEHMLEWSVPRREGALEALVARDPDIARDAKQLQRESYRGADVEAWAREQGWSETRIRAAKLRMVW